MAAYNYNGDVIRSPKKKRCTHRLIEVRTESDRCSWVQCKTCRKRGPSKHSYTLALMAWALHLTNQHPRGKTSCFSSR